ncbi:MAG: hypothetical protein ACKO2N_14930 [Tabrizicola sp.]
MTDTSYTAPSSGPGLRHPLVWVVLIGWSLMIALATSRGVFLANMGGIPFPLALAAVLPPLLYLLAWRLVPGVRAWVASLDLGWIVGAQTFRVIGTVFVMLWAMGDLPTAFGLTAGLGDMAVGLFALTVVLAVERKAAGWEGQVRTLVVVGLLDFVAAFGTATLSGQGFPLQLPGEGAPVLMLQLPMAMIPAFGVPLFIILHLMAWQKLPPRR